MSVDPNYDWLHSLSGELFYQEAESLAENDPHRKELYERALTAYEQGLEKSNPTDKQTRYRTLLSYARTLTRLDRTADALRTYQESLDVYPENPDSWRIEEILAQLNLQTGDRVQALAHAQKSLEKAPQDQKARL